MNRKELETSGIEITQKYFFMTEEMNRSQAEAVLQGDDTSGIYYYKVVQISKRWLLEERPLWQQMQELFVGLHAVGIPVSVTFTSDGEKLGVYVGSTAAYTDVVEGMLTGVFPRIGFEMTEAGTALYSHGQLRSTVGATVHSGYLKGNPTGSERCGAVAGIDSVVRGMAGKPWCLSIFAVPERKANTLLRHQKWLSLAAECSKLESVSYAVCDNAETTTYQRKFPHSQQYAKKVEAFCEKSAMAISSGEWFASISFSAGSKEAVNLLGGLLTAAFYGEASEPEPVHAVYCAPGDTGVVLHPGRYTHECFGQITYPRYGTYLTAGELAIYSAFPTRDVGGFAVVDAVDFDVERSIQGDLCLGKIQDQGRETACGYYLDSNELNRHCLVVGLTGSGKTNTVKSLICSMTKGRVKRPFMVIEPAKKEYWELYKLGFDDLQIYSVGSGEPGAHKLCINPFERAVFVDERGAAHAIPIQTHIDFVYAAFKASFIMYTPMPYVLERAIYAIYEDRGWDIHNNRNTTGSEIYPTIEDLYYKIPEVVTEMGYDQKMRNDLIGSLQARINSMRLGTKGDTLNVRSSFPMEKLLQGNVVIELEDIGDDDVKAFLISLILVGLLEYRRQQPDSQKEVKHLLLIEEAHRLLKNVQSGTGENADPRGAAVEFFCNLLAELRSKGQGFIVADQIPSKLAPDLIKNTNLKITHRTVAVEERELIGGAMHMTPEQIDSLSSLSQGVAAVYSEGDHRPKLVKAPYAGAFLRAERKELSRSQILRQVAGNVHSANAPQYRSQTNARTALCRHCEKRCMHLCEQDPCTVMGLPIDERVFRAHFEKVNPGKVASCTTNMIHDAIWAYMGQYMPANADMEKLQYCILQRVLKQWKLSAQLEEKILNIYMEEH